MCAQDNALFLEILYPDAVQPNDLELLRLPTSQRPGRARLCKARLGQAVSDTSDSQPVLSQSGAKIGFTAKAGLPTIDIYTYELVGEVTR